MKNLKILFQSRLDLFEKSGGDTVQIKETKEALQELGVEVDINNEIGIDVSDYDLVHVFNLDWVCETYPHVNNAKQKGKPVVLSPIHHSLEEFKRYENQQRYGLAKVGNFLLPHQPWRDEARNLVKGILNPKKLKPALIQAFMGIRKQQKKSLEMSDYVLVQTQAEAKDLQKDFKTNKFKWEKVVNGINLKTFKEPNAKKGRNEVDSNNYIYSVGRIEPRKNQLALIEAFKKLKKGGEYEDLKLIFTGGENKNHPTYLKKFKKKLSSNSDIMHTGYIEQSKLAHIYAGARVFCVPSWFETTGLVYLEAAVSGAQSIVASGDRAKEYLNNNALYCDPGNVESIAAALSKGLSKSTVEDSFKTIIKKTYTWKNTAEETLKVYKKLISEQT